MQAIRRKDTKPELAIRRLVHAAGLRYRVDHRLDLGAVKPRPDLVFTRLKIAVWIDGCYWHACPAHSKPPKVNTDYWGPKLERNVARDRAYDAALHAAGWTVVRLWEHQDPRDAAEEIIAAVQTHRRMSGDGAPDRPA